MISWWWLIIAFIAGMAFGAYVIAVYQYTNFVNWWWFRR